MEALCKNQERRNIKQYKNKIRIFDDNYSALNLTMFFDPPLELIFRLGQKKALHLKT